MVGIRRYYCNIKVDAGFNAGNLPKDNIRELNEKLRITIEEWAEEMTNRGLDSDIEWSWSEHLNL